MMWSFFRRVVRRLGIDIRRSSYNPDTMDFLKDRQINVVLDVGANIGQFGLSLRKKGYKGRIVSFEPIKSEFQKLATIAKKDGNWEAYNFALGATTGTATINVSDESIFSSIRKLNRAAVQFDSKAVVNRTETVEVRRLDEIATKLSGNILVKIDTQGYERQVLEGGKELLLHAKGILMELPIILLYEGNWQFHEAVEFMASVGFVPAQIQPVNYHSKDKVSLVEVDCIFRPRNIQLD